MADLKISQLTGATTPLAGTEVLPVVQSSTTKKVSVSNLTAGREVAASALLLNNTPRLSSAQISITGDGTNSPTFTQINAGTNSTKYNFASVSTDNTAYSIKLQIARYSGSYDLGFALRLVNNAATEFQAVEFKSNGDVSLDVGNLIQGTAAKGVNFTANTPLAGMTSQLLNWYEEGTWTPVVTSASGTITSYTATGLYTRVGRIVNATLRIQITNAGTGASAVIATLPYSGKSGWTQSGAGRDDNTGNMLQGRIAAGVEDKVYLFTFSNGSPIATGSDLFFTITYVV